MHNRLAHTAEHAFVGSLQKILGPTLAVRKVEHRDNNSSVIIKIQELNFQAVIEAEHEVNSLIYSGRMIKTQYYDSLSEARKYFPNLRANEERIREIDWPIRIVEIEGHDVAACALEHASNLHECEFFLVTGFSRTRGQGDIEYEIIFTVQNQAKEASMAISRKLLCICQELGANINTIEETVKKLNNERKENTFRLKRLTSEYLAKIKPSILAVNGKLNLIQEISCGLDDSEIQSFVGKMISHPDERTIILMINVLDHSQNAFVIFARSQSLGPIECHKMFNQYSYLGARGGGKPSLATGVVLRENVCQLMDSLITDARNLLQSSSSDMT